MPGAFHRARPAAGRHEAVGPSCTRLRHTGHHTVAGANKPRTPPVPVQNSPCSPKMALFGTFSSCWESFVPHQPRHHHGHERNNTPTQHSKPRGETFTAPAPHTNPRGETFTAPARHKQPKITHFHHAGANFLSTTGVKTKPTNSRMQFQLSRTPYQREIRRIPTIRLQTMKHIRGNCMRNYWSGVARRPEKSHVIRLDERSTKSENVAIPTI